jgi:hypothetical protein
MIGLKTSDRYNVYHNGAGQGKRSAGRVSRELHLLMYLPILKVIMSYRDILHHDPLDRLD